MLADDERPYYYLSTVGKAMSVLEQFTKADGQLSVSEIARRTGLPKSVAHRILATLTQLGFVAQDSSEGTYRLGVKSLELGLSYLRHSPIEQVAQIHMQNLISRFADMMSHVAILDGTEVLYQRTVVGSQVTYFTRATLGRRRPAYCNGLGKVLLAYLSPTELESYLALVELRPFTSTTITTPEALREELERIRRQESAVDRQENHADRRCVAAPIRDHTGRVVAALSLAGLPEIYEKYGVELLTGEIKATAAAISRDLGYASISQGMGSPLAGDSIALVTPL
jgi:DNA-binding IclR family transcriptional regulator